jgi:predicted TIM-barrel fold metal-dependent hydrolase
MQQLDIVDAQIHLFHGLGVEALLATMDGLGIGGALIDELWEVTADGGYTPYVEPVPGVRRAISPGAQMAAMRHADRMKYLFRINYRDPDLADWVRISFSDKNCLALRAEAATPDDIKALANGDFKNVFAAGARLNVPVFIVCRGAPNLIEPYIKEFSACDIILDHCGRPNSLSEYDDALRLAQYPNCYMKWCHPFRAFGVADRNFAPLLAQLKRAVEAFGAERILWASDFTAEGDQSGHSLYDCLSYIRDATAISAQDKHWILAGTARKLLRWPAPGSDRFLDVREDPTDVQRRSACPRVSS